MGANPHANGGLLLRDLRMPDFRDYAVDVPQPGAVEAQDMTVHGHLCPGCDEAQPWSPATSASSAPDETASNRLSPVFEVTGRRWEDRHRRATSDENLARDGRVMDSMLSEHLCQGWLEGYLLTGRHGFFNSYEAFIRIVDSMVSQHAKWLKVCNQLPWRQDIASLNYVLASNVWQQDHNGFTHQDPGFLDHVANKKADVVRLYLPPDANCLLCCFDHCIQQPELRQRHGRLQAPPSPVAHHGAGRQALHPGHRHLAVGLQRPGAGARRGHGLLRRHADA